VFHSKQRPGPSAEPPTQTPIAKPIGRSDRHLKHRGLAFSPFIDTAEEGDAFYGYTGPGYREDFWILDVDGTRLVVASERSPGSPRKDVAELSAILDSIRIEP
jgi:hypothetical protein